jgi:hypothetical protein
VTTVQKLRVEKWRLSMEKRRLKREAAKTRARMADYFYSRSESIPNSEIRNPHSQEVAA